MCENRAKSRDALKRAPYFLVGIQLSTQENNGSATSSCCSTHTALVLFVVTKWFSLFAMFMFEELGMNNNGNDESEKGRSKKGNSKGDPPAR